MSKTKWRIKVGVLIGTIIILVSSHCNIMFEIKWDTYRNNVLFLWSQSAKGECISQCLYRNPLNTLSHRECVQIYRLNSRFKRIYHVRGTNTQKSKKPGITIFRPRFKTFTKNTSLVLQPRPLPRFHEQRNEDEILFCF